MSEHLVPAIKSLSLIHTIPLNEKLLVRDKLCLGHFCSSMLEPFFAFLKCRHQEQNERCIPKEYKRTPETLRHTWTVAKHIKRGKGEMSLRWADKQAQSKERAGLLPHTAPMWCVVFCGTGLCSKAKRCSKHPLGLEQLHQGAAFHLWTSSRQPSLRIGTFPQSLVWWRYEFPQLSFNSGRRCDLCAVLLMHLMQADIFPEI